MWSRLTDSQREAIEHDRGPLLVLAGPGSGKTRVITCRIARLIQRGVAAQHILGLTFTNKAAQEMAERVRQLCPNRFVWLGTFHRFCSRLLRRHASAVGLKENFVVFDTADQRQLVKEVLSELGYDPVHFAPDKILEIISRAKNELLTPEQFAEQTTAVADYMRNIAAKVYREYQRRLLELNAADFDDLLLHVVRLLRENDALRQELDLRFQYVLVDEYQDTNLAQYLIVASISQLEPNLCVTGDPDQSIYGWRGARLENILRFERDFPGAKVIRLEQNFRSTRSILRSAGRLISYNRFRKQKELLTDSDEGPPVELWCFADEQQEAEGVARAIRQMVETGEVRWGDVAVFYRVNSLARDLELAMTRLGVPYQIAAGVEFYSRAEVRDLLAYLRVLSNPADDLAFLRILNRPQRGIGRVTQRRLVEWAGENGWHLKEAAARARENPVFSKQAASRLVRFVELLERLSLAEAGSVEALLHAVIERTGYTRAWEDSPDEKDQERLAVVRELLKMAASYDQQAGAEVSLEGFLESTSLASEVDTLDPSSGRVTLMTLHAAKGLEFPVVFIVALEHSILPHERALNSDNPHEYEEERRLLFVGMTRAMKRLILTRAARRPIHGRYFDAIPSPFLSELEYEMRDFTHETFSDPLNGAAPLRSPTQPKCATEQPACTISPSQPQTTSTADSPKQHQQHKQRLQQLLQQQAAEKNKRPKLTTGAALLEGRQEAASVPFGFQIGMRVRHPRFGPGTVVDVDGFARNRKVIVQFDDQHRESFDLFNCPLQPIGMR